MKPSTSVTWPLVGLALIGAGFLVAVLVVIPREDTQSRSAVLGVLVTLAAGATAWFSRNKVNQVQEGVDDVNTKVNGRMTELVKELGQAREALDRALEREQQRNDPKFRLADKREF
jgi:hypothetical protein